MLSAYLDDQVTLTERARIEGHLAGCIACRGELDGLRRTVTLLQALPRVPVPRAFTLSEAQVGIRRPPAQPAWAGWTRGLAAVTALALVAVVAVSLLNRPAWQPAATVARSVPTAAAPQPAAQPAAPAENAPPAALAKAPPPAAPTAAPAQAVEKAAAVTDAQRQVAATETAPTAPAAEPVAAESGAAPPAEEAARAAAEAPSLMAAAAPVPQETPSAGLMALGRGAGGAAEIPAQPPEPTPALVQPAAVLPAAVGFAFADEQGLWAVNGESGTRQLVAGEGISLPIISADRSRIAYRLSRGDYGELWTLRWDGADARLLLSERDLPGSDLPAGYTGRRLNAVQWLPGRDILAVTTVAIPESAELLPKLEIWHLDVESGALRRVIDMGRAAHPFYSPDGTQFALLEYGTEADPTGSLTLADADGTDGRVALRFPAGPDTASSDSQIAWLPDGTSLWVYIPDRSASSGAGSGAGGGEPLNGATLYRVPVTDGDAQSAGRVDGAQVSWSPDGSRLAYTRVGPDGNVDLFLANADGANPRLYASLKAGSFTSWSPDGRHFLYTDGAGQTYAGAPDLAPRLLGKSLSLFDPRWISPQALLALHDTGTEWLLVARTLDGSAAGIQPLSRAVTYDVTKP
jgi:hypothetical protein